MFARLSSATALIVPASRGAARERHAQVRGGQPAEGPEVARHEDLVDEDLEQPDRRRLERGTGRGEQQRHEQPAAQRAGERPEPPEDVADRDGGRLWDEPLHATGPSHERTPPGAGSGHGVSGRGTTGWLHDVDAAALARVAPAGAAAAPAAGTAGAVS